MSSSERASFLPAALVRTTCPYCGVGCGVVASRDPGGRAQILGDPAHPANFGRLCMKGMSLGDTLGLDQRLLHPMQRQPDQSFAPVTWDTALRSVAESLSALSERHGPNSIAFYLSGQLLTEDYCVANKLMKGFIGSANVDTNSRLCMASTVAGHRRAFGADTVPACYEDLDLADLIVLVGSNTAWCHPILFQRILQQKARGARVIVIDTRRTVTADSADLFLQITPGGDQVLFSGLLVHLADSGLADSAYISRCTSGYEAALGEARLLASDPAVAAAAADVPESAVAAFFDLFASTERVVTVFSQGVNQSAQGVDKVNAILNCHLATGRIGRPGASPFSFTGQPNAMGGREVGGLANMLAAHMGFDAESIDRVQRFWNAPHIARGEGLKAVQMFDAIARGEIRALWIAGTNPAASMPNADAAREALGQLELLIISENVRSNDTIHSGAHILLPALAWGEKDGTVTNSERRISRQRAFLPTPGEARADWAIFADVARRMGFEGFCYHSAAQVFREHAALSAFENGGRRDFDLGGLAELSDEAYDRLEPTFWPVRAPETVGQSRFFAQGKFYTPDGRARFIAPAAPALATRTTPEFPLRLNTGRLRDQWHTMTRTGASPRLARETREPVVEISAADAALARLVDKGFAQLTTALGSCILRVHVTDRQPEGQIFVPIHWTNETSSHGRVGALVASIIDPVSGQPEAKATPVSVSPVSFMRQGFVLARRPLALPVDVWWARVTVEGAIAYQVASGADEAVWREFLECAAPGAELVEFSNPSRGILRVAALLDDKVEAVMSLGPQMEDWDLTLNLFHLERIDPLQLQSLVTDAAPEHDGASRPIRAALQKMAPQRSRALAEYVAILKSSSLLSRASDQLLGELVGEAPEFVLETGEILFCEGDPGDAVYIVVDGRLQIFTKSPAGEEMLLAVAAAGEVVGEHYLFQSTNGRRGASARALEPTTLLRMEGNSFFETLARDSELARRFRERRDARETANLSKRSEIFRLLNSLGAVDPQSSVHFETGVVIFRERDAADAAWLIVSGEAIVYHEATPVQPLARLSAGQCFGERACLEDSPRAASVRALTALEAIRISKEHFVRLHRLSPALRDVVSGLQFVYHLPHRGTALQYVSEKAGTIAIERLYRLENNKRFLSSWMPALNAFRLQQLDVSPSTRDVQEFNWVEPGGDDVAKHRSIRVCERGEIIGFASVGDWSETPRILEAAIDGVRLSAEALRAFTLTGELEIGTAPSNSDEQACFCLQVSVEAIRSLVETGYNTFESLRSETGCGSICGGCEPLIQSILGRDEWIPVTGHALELAPEIRSIVLTPVRAASITWKVGQFVVLSGRIGGHWVNRSYTITSAPDGSPLEITVKREPNGLFSRWLFDDALAEKELRVSFPRGESVWAPSTRPTVCFVAGIGVTPAVAILRACRSQSSVGPLHVDYSGRMRETMAFVDEFEAASSAHDDITVHFRFTSKSSRLVREDVAGQVRKFPQADFFVCGPENYIDQVVNALKEEGIPPIHIFEERFVHAGTSGFRETFNSQTAC